MLHYSKQIQVVVCAIIFLTAATLNFAAEGDLDTTFDGDGIVVTNNGGENESVTDVIVQPDGKIIAVGISYINNGSAATQRSFFVRYNANGSVDSSFGTSGRVTVESAGVTELALQPNGKIVFVGSFGELSNTDIYVGRFNADGSFDTSFNGSGTVTLDLRGVSDSLAAVKILPDGKILTGGRSIRSASDNRNDFALVRFNADGSLDTTFDGDGKVFTTILPTGGSAVINDLEIQPDGKIITAGSVIVVDTPGDDPDEIFAVARYNANGSLDTTFSGDGIDNPRLLPVSTNGTTANSFATNVFVRNTGKILIIGTALTCCAPTPTRVPALVQYNADGSLDTTFDGDGRALIEAPAGFFVRDAVVQPDNKIVLTGTRGITSQVFASVLRLNADASLDLTFSGDGRNAIESPPNTFANAVALQPDGKIVIGGSFPSGGLLNSDFLLARFQASSCLANCFPLRQRVADFDGDGKTDLSVYRNGEWLIRSSSASNSSGFYGVNFGLATDKLAPVDYDGDGKTDVAVFRENPADPGRARFFILGSSNNLFREEQFGATGDVPVPGFWDGDARADLAVYRPGTQANPQGYFYYRPSSQLSVNFVSIPFGTFGDKPVAADFDGDGHTDAAVFRPSNGVWYVQRSRDGFYAVQFGAAEDKPVVGDYDGDGKSDFAVFRPSNGFWYVLKSADNSFAAVQFGVATDRPVPGDYDGDGKTDFAIYRDGAWFVLNSTSGFAAYNFGTATDRPVPNTYVR